jgi:hypothetical protein
MNPFGVLLPENWAHIRSFLMHPWDARDCVALQRTCRAAAHLDPGTLWAPEWTRPQDVDADPYTRYERIARTYILMRTVFQSVLTSQPWFIWPLVLTTGFYEDDEPEIRVNLEWRISPDIRVILGYDKFGVNAQGEEPWEWSVKIAKPCYSDTNPGVVQSIEVLGDNIDDIMDKVPLLGLGIDPCRIRTFAHREELKQLFLSKHELERLK